MEHDYDGYILSVKIEHPAAAGTSVCLSVCLFLCPCLLRRSLSYFRFIENAALSSVSSLTYGLRSQTRLCGTDELRPQDNRVTAILCRNPDVRSVYIVLILTAGASSRLTRRVRDYSCYTQSARAHTHVERDCRQMSKPDITSHTSYIRRSGLYLVDAVVPVAWE